MKTLRAAVLAVAFAGLALACQLLIGIRDDDFVVEVRDGGEPEWELATAPCDGVVYFASVRSIAEAGAPLIEAEGGVTPCEPPLSIRARRALR